LPLSPQCPPGHDAHLLHKRALLVPSHHYLVIQLFVEPNVQ